MPLPAELAGVLEALRAADREAEALVAGLDGVQANWQPGQGAGWSVAQCLDHLARANREYLPPMEEALRRARERRLFRRRPVGPGLFGGWFARELEPPPRRRMWAPRAIIPASDIPPAEALSSFLESQREVRRLLEESADLDLSVRFANPFLRGLRFRTAAGFRIVAAHDRRHLWQARRVLEAPGFPGR